MERDPVSAPVVVRIFEEYVAGPLYAYVDHDDRHHQACLDLVLTHEGPLVVPILVATEVAYLIETRRGPEAEVRFLGDIASRSTCDRADRRAGLVAHS